MGNSVHTHTMKKLINSPQDVVRQELEGMEAAHGDRFRISYDPIYIVRRSPPAKGKVALISGGGSSGRPIILFPPGRQDGSGSPHPGRVERHAGVHPRSGRQH